MGGEDDLDLNAPLDREPRKRRPQPTSGVPISEPPLPPRYQPPVDRTPTEISVSSPPDPEIERMTVVEETVRRGLDAKDVNDIVRQGVVQPADAASQIDLIKKLYPLVFEDVTQDVNLQSNVSLPVEGPSAPIVLVSDLPLKQNRVYIPRTLVQPHLYVARSVVPTNINGAALTLNTAMGGATHKRFLSVEMVFWTTAARAAKETTTARTITFERIIKPSQAPTGTPDLTRVIIYQATATINPSDRTAGDLVVQSDPLYLARNEELRLTIGSVASDVFVDVLIYVEVRY